MHTSVLDRMCGGLCDAVLETTRVRGGAQALERSNRFVVPLDRRGEWYRYHHLFGQLLRNELERARARSGGGAQPSRDGLVHGERPAGGGDRLRTGRRRDDRRRRPGRPARPVALLRRAHGDRGGVARVVRRRRPGALPRARRLRRLVPRVDRPAGRGRVVALPRRRGHLGDPALGRQHDDRALGGQPARLHDGERRRAVARGREPARSSCSRPRAPGEPSALLIRGIAHALLGVTDRARADLAAAIEIGLARTSPTTSSSRRPSSRSSRCGGARGTRPDGTRGRRRTLVEESGSRRLRDERARARRDRARRPPRRQASRRPRGAGARPPAAARCSTTRSPGSPSRSASSSPASISRWARSPLPAPS